MAIGKQFDEETGYAASRDIPPQVLAYMQSTGKTEEEVAKEILEAVKEEEKEELQPQYTTPDDNGWTDLKKLFGSIGKSVSDYRDTTDPMYRVGLVNAIFGDPSMLGQYYQMQNANEQARLNREAQNAYNSYWKELELAQKKADEDKEKAKQLNTAKVEYAKLLKDLSTASPAESIILNRQIDALEQEYPELASMANMRKDAETARNEEAAYQAGLVDYSSKLPFAFATESEKTKKISEIAASGLRDADKQKLVDQIKGIKSAQQLKAEAVQSAVASGAGKDVEEGRDTRKLSEKVQDAISSKTPPSKLNKEVRAELLKTHEWSNHYQEWRKK